MIIVGKKISKPKKKSLNQHYFCSHSCSAKFSNKQRIFSDESRKKISQKLKGRRYKQPQKCVICNNEIPIHKGGKTCSKECEKEFRKLRQAHVGGGYRKGASRGKHGYYKGFYCDSTYELAYLIYCLDHNIKIERCKETFQYFYNNKIHTYHPDFLVDGIIVEIKNFYSELTDIKINSVKKMKRQIKVFYKEDMRTYLEYVAINYSLTLNKNLSNDFEKLYNKSLQDEK